MRSIKYRSLVVVTALTTTAITLASGCAETSIEVGTFLDNDAGPQPPSFTPVDAGSNAEASTQRPLDLCISTTCPAPYDTCGDGYRCNTNVSNDSKNCGACGNECPAEFGYLNMTSTCVNGMCEPVCAKQLRYMQPAWNFGDCNKVLEDGCEINLSTDPNNCGACGNRCADGVICVDGKCGLEPGQMICNDQVIDVRSDNFNCGSCWNYCEPPLDAPELPPNMEYGCVNGQCGQPRCYDDGFGTAWTDCDNNLEKNGCEVYVGQYNGGGEFDPNNCGTCGKKCTGDQFCAVVSGAGSASCVCENPQHTRCGSIETYNLGCYDLLNDIENCGTCFSKCTAYRANTTAACRKGLCEVECTPGWGDCDGNPNNGCETNLKVSDGHCGACGNRCDTQAGQPCVDGQCAVTECDAGAGPQ